MADTQPGGAKKIPFEFTQGTFWGGPWYPYWSLIVFSVLGGFFGLDHVWLRSPMTGFIKFLVNCVTFGFWWFYDMVQIFSEKDNVMKFGLSAPLYGPMGLGAGIFRDNQPGVKLSKSPFRYLLYLPLVFLPIGLDFLVAGDSNGALFRLLSLFIFILWPLAFVWTFINVYYAYANPKSLFEKGTTRFFPWSWIGDPNGPSKLGPKDVNYPPDGCDPGGIRGVLRGIVSAAGTAVGTAVSTVVNTALPGVLPAASAVGSAVKVGADTASGVISATGSVAEGVLSTTGTLIKEAGPPLAVAAKSAAVLAAEVPPAIAGTNSTVASVGSSLASKYTNPDVLKTIAKQAGGSLGGGGIEAMMSGGGTAESASFTDAALILLLTSLFAGGVVMAFKRLKTTYTATKRDDGRTRDDPPPKPHGV
jgi:hypothetical protein